MYFLLRNTKYSDSEVPKECQDALKGIVITVEAHKTISTGPALLWLSQTDMVLCQAYMAIVNRYAKKIGKPYPLSGPMFVNKKLTQWKSRERQVDYEMFKKINDIASYESHDNRRGFASLAGDHPSIFVREAAASAACHSVATQQSTYLRFGLIYFKYLVLSRDL